MIRQIDSPPRVSRCSPANRVLSSAGIRTLPAQNLHTLYPGSYRIGRVCGSRVHARRCECTLRSLDRASDRHRVRCDKASTDRKPITGGSPVHHQDRRLLATDVQSCVKFHSCAPFAAKRFTNKRFMPFVGEQHPRGQDSQYFKQHLRILSSTLRFIVYNNHFIPFDWV